MQLGCRVLRPSVKSGHTLSALGHHLVAFSGGCGATAGEETAATGMVVKGERIAAWTLLVLSAAIFIPSPRPLRADVLPCSGTRLKLSVQERGRSAIERFRFSLAVSGEGADEATALQQLK